VVEVVAHRLQQQALVVPLRAALGEQGGDRGVARLQGEPARRPQLGVGAVRVGVLVEQERDDGEVALPGRGVQGRLAVAEAGGRRSGRRIGPPRSG
jgi:hypothetical protein